MANLRPGYRTGYGASADARDKEDQELRYTHFGVLFSTVRRGLRVAAVNIDGAAGVPIKRGQDQRFYDLRIPRACQLGAHEFAGPDIDRRRLVRHEDPNWGGAAQQANDDTFHRTNASVQPAALYQGKSLWQGLENYILDRARTEGFRASVFTGPIFRPADPALTDGGPKVPLQFWKVVGMQRGGGGLHATGYLPSQGDLIRDLLEKRNRNEAFEGFKLGGQCGCRADRCRGQQRHDARTDATGRRGPAMARFRARQALSVGRAPLQAASKFAVNAPAIAEFITQSTLQTLCRRTRQYWILLLVVLTVDGCFFIQKTEAGKLTIAQSQEARKIAEDAEKMTKDDLRLTQQRLDEATQFSAQLNDPLSAVRRFGTIGRIRIDEMPETLRRLIMPDLAGARAALAAGFDALIEGKTPVAQGYDVNFLGIPLALLRAPLPPDQYRTLPYDNYNLVYVPQKERPVVAAVTIDRQLLASLARVADAAFPDPRLDVSGQPRLTGPDVAGVHLAALGLGDWVSWGRDLTADSISADPCGSERGRLAERHTAR